MIARERLREVVEVRPGAVVVACSGEPALDDGLPWTRAATAVASEVP